MWGQRCWNEGTIPTRPQVSKHGAQPTQGQSHAPHAIRIQEMSPSSTLMPGSMASGDETQALPACRAGHPSSLNILNKLTHLTHQGVEALGVLIRMIKFTCQLGWAMMPRYLVKHYSVCFCEDTFSNEISLNEISQRLVCQWTLVKADHPPRCG